MLRVFCLFLCLMLLSAPALAEAVRPDNTFSPAPQPYLSNSPAQSRIERVTYHAKTEHGIDYVKTALVYLPDGYDDNPETRYDILYLMHGGGENETTFLGGEHLEKPLKHLLDNMIASGKIPPVIVCAPCYRIPYCDETQSTQKFPRELRETLMPLVESTYRTYAETADDAGFTASREHRAFGGFSMGGAATWCVFEQCLDWYANFLPMSGDCWSIPGTADKRAAYLAQRVTEQGYTPADFCIYAGCGNKSDVAYGNLVPQINAMKLLDDTFIWCENFDAGNLYFASYEGSGHSHQTCLHLIYNALPTFFCK